MIKARQFIIVKASAACGLIIPEGISLTLVLAFLASISRSAHLLNDIAADLAKTIQSSTGKSNKGFTLKFIDSAPARKPINAKGKAKTV